MEGKGGRRSEGERKGRGGKGREGERNRRVREGWGRKSERERGSSSFALGRKKEKSASVLHLHFTITLLTRIMHVCL